MKKILSCLLIAALGLLPCAAWAEEGGGALGLLLGDDADGRLFGSVFEALCERDDVVCMTRYAASAQEQAEQLEELAEDCEALIIAPLGGIETSLPVVALESDIPGAACTVRFDADADARIIADEILALLEREGASMNVECAAGDLAADGVYAKALEILQPRFDEGSLVCLSGETAFEQVATGAERLGDASARMEAILTEHYAQGEKLSAVLCSDSEAALGVMQSFFFAYTGEGMPFVTGVGCSRSTVTNIIDEIQPMTVFHDPRTLAEAAYAAAKALLGGGTPEGEILCAPVRMDAENYKALVFDSGLYEADENGYPVDTEGEEIIMVESDPPATQAPAVPEDEE